MESNEIMLMEAMSSHMYDMMSDVKNAISIGFKLFKIIRKFRFLS